MKQTRTIPCPVCDGSGVDPDDQFVVCDMCMGQRHIDVNAGDVPENVEPLWVDDYDGEIGG